MIKFLMLTPEVLNTNLSWMEKALISLLGIYTRRGKQTTTASDKYMAKELNVSPVYINRTLRKLKENEYIEFDKDLGRRAIKLTGGKHYIYKFGKSSDVGDNNGE